MEWMVWTLLLLFAFYGSRRDDTVTRIRLFGFTVYERRRDSALPPPTTTFALDDGGDDEANADDADERDGRTLLDRLRDAGIAVIDRDLEDRSLRLSDVGALEVEDAEEDCDACNGDLVEVREVHPLPNVRQGSVRRAAVNPLGRVCDSCGRFEFIAGKAPAHHGKFAVLLDEEPNFFDVIDYLDRVSRGDVGAAAEAADPTFLERRRDQLEAELNEVRLALKRRQLESGHGDPYRDSFPEDSERKTAP